VPTTTRGAHGLPDDAFVYCSFNKAAKLEPVMFAMWMRILQRVPQGLLWLLGEGTVARNLKREAVARAVDPDRVVVAPPIAKLQHLSRLRLADLMLDTRVYGGHVTTWDALWMGVPVVTLIGPHLPARVSASALTAVGLPQLITHEPAEYEALAVRLAGDRLALASLRDHLLRARTTAPLADSARWIASLERAFLAMWDRFRAGLPPAAIDVAP